MQDAGAYRARFQAQRGLSDLPVLPDSQSLGPLPDLGADMPPAPAVLPQGGSSELPSGGGLRDVEVPDLNMPGAPGYLAPSQPANTLSSTPPPNRQPPQAAPNNDPAKVTSMPNLGGSQMRPSPEATQLTSQADLASSELRVRERSSSPVLPRNTPSTAPAAGSQPRVPAQAVTTGQPFVSPGRPRGRYATQPINPAFYQLAAFQRDASGRNVAIGTYPAGAQTPVQPPRQNHPADQVAASQQQANTNTPARFTSNATPMPATALAASRQRAYENPGFYQTAFTQQCNGPGFPSGGMPAPGVNGAYVPPTLTPGSLPGMYTPNNAGYSPLFTLGQENYNVALGRGIIGQPTVYVAGQPVRNFLRYLSP
ncbi:MAG: hypothetical protein Aurels2KO_17870 [Aureliella sp.]